MRLWSIEKYMINMASSVKYSMCAGRSSFGRVRSRIQREGWQLADGNNGRRTFLKSINCASLVSPLSTKHFWSKSLPLARLTMGQRLRASLVAVLYRSVLHHSSVQSRELVPRIFPCRRHLPRYRDRDGSLLASSDGVDLPLQPSSSPATHPGLRPRPLPNPLL